MPKVLICDTECNSLDTKEGFVQELGWGIYQTETKRFLKSQGSLIRWPQMYVVDQKAQKVTGLSYGFTQSQGVEARFVFQEFLHDLGQCEFVCGHNYIGYDGPMLISNSERALPGLQTRANLEQVKKVDTLIDLPYPDTVDSLKLKYCSFEHGYILSGAHQALNDVNACAHLLSQYPWEQVLEISQTPVVTVRVVCSWTEKEKHQLLKENKFRFDKDTKSWVRQTRRFFIDQIVERLNMPCAAEEIS